MLGMCPVIAMVHRVARHCFHQNRGFGRGIPVELVRGALKKLACPPSATSLRWEIDGGMEERAEEGNDSAVDQSCRTIARTYRDSSYNVGDVSTECNVSAQFCFAGGGCDDNGNKLYTAR